MKSNRTSYNYLEILMLIGLKIVPNYSALEFLMEWFDLNLEKNLSLSWDLMIPQLSKAQIE